MNTVLWIIQILLAFVLLYHGWLMWFLPAPTQQGALAYIMAIPFGQGERLGHRIGSGKVQPIQSTHVQE